MPAFLVSTTVALILLALLVALICLPTIRGEFISDDYPQIADNPFLVSAEFIPKFFTENVWSSTALELENSATYRPLFLLWLWALFQLGGPDPALFHLGNILLHSLNVILAFFTLRRLVPSLSRNLLLLGTALFAVHPAQAQSVAWISAVTEPLVGVFFQTAFLLFCRFYDDGNPGHLAGFGLSFAMALLAKETALALPLVIAAYVALAGAAKVRRAGIALLGSAFLVVGYFGLRALATSGTGMELSWGSLSRGMEALILAGRYCVFPMPNFFILSYPHGGIAGLLDVATFTVLLLLAAALTYRERYLLLPALWCIFTFAPALAASLNPTVVFSLRTLYLPLIGFSGLLVGGLSHVLSNDDRYRSSMVATLLLLSIGGTLYSMSDFKDDKRLYELVLTDSPRQLGGYEGLADYYRRNGDLEVAIEYLEQAIDQVLDNDKRLAATRLLGNAYAESRQYEKSRMAFEALLGTDQEVEGLLGLGNLSWIEGDLNGALHTYREAVQLDSRHFQALVNLGRLSVITQDLDGLETACQGLTYLDPDSYLKGERELALNFLSSHCKYRG